MRNKLLFTSFAIAAFVLAACSNKIEENNLLLEIKELENEQQLMRIRNEQLSQDVDSKNRGLAVSTMCLNSKMGCWLL
jgi:outer membrane murein-binding lipoprotein Lpp